MSGAKKRVPKRRFKEFLNAGDWEQRKLGDLTQLITKGTTPKVKNIQNGINFIKVENISDDGVISINSYVSEEEHMNYLSRSILSNDDILFSIAGTLGRTAIVKSHLLPANTNQALAIIRLNKSVDVEYINTFLKSNAIKTYIRKNPTVGAQPNLSLGQVSDLEINIPSYSEQKKISNLFSNFDLMITLHQRKLDKLQATKKALLQEMFPEEGQDKPKRRFKGFTDAWEQRKLGDIVDFLDGQRKPLKESDRIKGKYPYYGASGIIDYINDYLFDENLVLLSEDGANIIDRNYPVCFIATGKYWVNNHAHVLKAKAGVIDKFICESLERLDYTKFNTGTAQPKLNQDICQKIVITIPNEDEQKCISEFLNRINNIITLHQRKLDKLKNLKQAYLNEMFV